MRRIIKGTTPTNWPKNQTYKVAKQRGKRELMAKSLLDEQGYLCAYCEQQIDLRNSRIEHIKPQNSYPALQMDYSNMVVCCCGDAREEDSQNNSNPFLHCDNSKGDTDISFSPTEEHIFPTLSYIYNEGAYHLHSNNSSFQRDINEVLNLNCPYLLEHRRRAITAINKVLDKGGVSKVEEYRTRCTQLDQNGKLPAFPSVILWYLSKF